MPQRIFMRDIAEYATRYASVGTDEQRPSIEPHEADANYPAWMSIVWDDARAAMTMRLVLIDGKMSYEADYDRDAIAPRIDGATTLARAELMRRAVALGSLIESRFYPNGGDR